jgi:hypothetical protein
VPRVQFRQRDLKAAIQAAKAAGLTIAQIKINKDGITIVPGPGEPTPEPAAPYTDPETLAIDEAIRNAKV